MFQKGSHWADETAAKIIFEKGDKELYTCASGITPSGTVHVGNFREIISVDLVVRALRDMGKKVRFIYSWDDYDVFRKVPANMPNPQVLEQYLRFPIVEVPDPWNRDSSYARHHEVDVETVLPTVGIVPEYIYQAERYRSASYAEGIRTALEHKHALKDILNAFRDDDHQMREEYWPISAFCTNCMRDTTEIDSWDGAWNVSYHCTVCDYQETVDIRHARGIKLLWRVDWPMRWKQEQVDFEPAGKDHHAAGGSFDTARRVSTEVYAYDAPVTFRYDFIGIKGIPGKMASSSGKIIDLPTLLDIYTPELVRFLFAGTRPNTEFVISFDLDVLKVYEDYDKTERIAWNVEPVKDEAVSLRERRIYALSQVGAMPTSMPYQIPFRHLCNLIQIADGDYEKVISAIPTLKADQIPTLRNRCICALNWINLYAPPDFKFKLRSAGEKAPLNEQEIEAVRAVRDSVITAIEQYATDKQCAAALYAVAESLAIDHTVLFKALYQALIAKDQGPRLANFLRSLNKERVLQILAPY
ncbi:putative lysyl-tRNA synthetase, class I [Pillotina sp. SPG140]|jgi:lysyl-tRNA synthetase class 1